jgi:hypothetical protein
MMIAIITLMKAAIFSCNGTNRITLAVNPGAPMYTLP